MGKCMAEVTAKSLKQLKDLSAMPLSRLERLAENLSIKSFNKNELVFDQDEEAKFVYILLSGVVQLSYFNSDEGQTIVSLLPAGEFFGLDALTPNTRHPFRCETVDNSSLGAIKPKVLIEALLGVSYEIFLQWYVAALEPDRKSYIHCVKGIGLDLRRRLALELLNLADRFGKPDPRGIIIGLNISHEVLAGLVGASRQQVTQYLNEFDREKTITRQGRRIIVRTEKLRRALESKP
jgi:CRP/FNR family cyclic AMP-dependent transcriptional regulator